EESPTQPEPEPEYNNDSSNDKVNVEELIAKNGDSPTLNLSLQGITDQDMNIVANALENNTVRI
ncbi:unnamed protein product, partial [Rotaria magnacalcarata]